MMSAALFRLDTQLILWEISLESQRSQHFPPHMHLLSTKGALFHQMNCLSPIMNALLA